MNRIVFPCFPTLILTKFVRSARWSIDSIIRNHATDLLLQNADKNTYEKISILRKYADGYAATSLTLNSFVCVFFSFWVFFHKHSRFTGLQGKGKAVSLTHLYYNHPLQGLEPGTLVSKRKWAFPFTCNWDSSKLVTFNNKKWFRTNPSKCPK